MTLSRRFFRLAPSALLIAAGFASGCTNFDRFTAGRMPYGGLAENNAPQDPFLGSSDATRVANASSGSASQSPSTQAMVAQTTWNGQALSSEGSTAYSTGPQTAMQQPNYAQPQQEAYAPTGGYPSAQQYASSQPPAGSPQQGYAPQQGYPAPQGYSTPQGYSPPQGYAQQVAYPPVQEAVQQPAPYQAASSERPQNPFATDASGSGIQQMSYEAPVAPPANPFAEIEGAPVSAQSPPVFQPMTQGSTTGVPVEQWQSAPTTTHASAEAFLPPVQR